MAKDTSAAAYVGLCPECRAIYYAGVDEPDRTAARAEEVAACIRIGLIVERWTVEEVRRGRFQHAPSCSRRVGRE